MPVSHVVVVYNSRIVRLIQYGEGNRWNKSKAEQIKSMAVLLAPKRSGRLAASHGVEQNRNAMGQYQTGHYVFADAPYARYVHDGTGLYGPHGRVINIGKRMGPIPGGGVGGLPRFIRSSRGQRPQPWLQQAADAVL